LFGSDLLQTNRKLKEKYGNIYSLSLGPYWAVFVNDSNLLHEVFVKHAKSLPNKLVKFPMNGKGVGPGGISTGRRDLTQKNVKTNDTRIKERFQPLNSSKI
jgi:hypothetical protein